MSVRDNVIFNVVFWSLYFIYEWLGLASLYGNYHAYFINALMAFPVSLIFSMLVVHLLFPVLLRNKHTIEFWSVFIISSFLLLLIRRYVNYYFVYPEYFPFALNMPFISFGKFIVELVELYTITGLYTLYYLIIDRQREQQRVHELVQERTRSELDNLKAQVQPHFVFNTLNNIYGTALKSSPETASLIAHLSGLLNYSLYYASREWVNLQEEIGYLRNYTELQKNKYGKQLDVAINVYEDLSGLVIAPLLLLPLVENCFKHGVSKSTSDSWVRVDFSREPGLLSVVIENSVSDEPVQTCSYTGGLGIANVRKRLQHLYPGNHQLKISEGANSYLVVIKIQIQKT